MKHRETPRAGYGQGNISKDDINCSVYGNVNRGDSEKGGDAGFRQSNGHVKGSKKSPRGMNKNAY